MSWETRSILMIFLTGFLNITVVVTELNLSTNCVCICLFSKLQWHPILEIKSPNRANTNKWKFRVWLYDLYKTQSFDSPYVIRLWNHQFQLVRLFKAILKTNQISWRGDSNLLKTCLKGMGMFLLCLNLATIFFH